MYCTVFRVPFRSVPWIKTPSRGENPTLTPMGEYQKILERGPDLRVAFQDHLVSLAEDLLAAGLLADDNVAVVLNENQPVPHRASKLLEFIRNRVKLYSKNYYTFVGVLKKTQRSRQYKGILQIRESNNTVALQGSFLELGGTPKLLLEKLTSL